MKILIATQSNLNSWLDMRKKLWPETSDELHLVEIKSMLSQQNKFICYIAFDNDNHVGFIESSIREDIDEGCIIKNIGYIEGWYIEKTSRNKGVGKKLVEAVENWSRDHGCFTIGSDTNLENDTSQKAHLSLGFEEVDRAIHYRKKLET
ncbi:MAG TPA: aminoglycoside 6'-N-acetyltransferase [Victivallales bacterium]|nr:aminoglycoside 6'-N-acetyltransferase [Victivallales bacterium]